MADWLSRIDNLAPNPSFETVTTGWAAGFSGGTGITIQAVTRSAVWKWAGQWSGYTKITALTTAPTAIYLNTTTTFTDATSVKVTPDKTYSFGIRAKTNNTNRKVRLSVVFRNSSNVNVGTTALAEVNVDAAGEAYVKLEGIIAPAGVSHCYIVVGLYALSGTLALNDELYADGLTVSPTEQVPTYVDGSFGTYHHWTGTAHQSPSYRDPLPVLQTAKRYGQTVISSELWLANIDNTLYEDISTNALEGKVSTNVHNAIKSALSLTVKEPELIRPYTDVVAPIINVTGSDGVTYRHQLGLFICTPAKQTHRESLSTGNLEARDLTWILANDYFGTTYSVAAGENAIAKVITILTSCGLTRYSLPDAGTLFTVARTWPADKSKLEIVNDILNGIGYYTIWADRQGILTSRPYFELASAEPALRLFSGEGGQVIEAIEQEGVYEGVANKVIVYKENTQGNPIIVRRTNTSPLSPVSTVNLGRTITKVIKDTNIASVTVARAMASAALETSASFTNKLKVITMPLPDRELHEVYDLAIYNKQGKPVGFGLWWCDGTEMGFTLKTAKQTHMLKRLEPYDGPEEVVS
jgi:hypothetical protein